MNTVNQGNEHLWIQKPDAAAGAYELTDADYETGKTYIFTLERDSDNLIWTVEEDGNEIYSYEETGPDFRRLVLESWSQELINDLGLPGEVSEPSVEVKEVTIEDN